MKRIDTSTKVTDLFGPGKHGFRNSNVALGQAATDFNADWPNNLQEEVANAIEAAGLALDGNVRTQLLQALRGNGLLYATDIGAANAVVLTYTPAIPALVDGMVLWFKALATNTGATTVNVNGLGAVPIVGGAHAALQGGEVVANGRCQVVYNATLNSFVLIECTGASLQVGAATKSQHAPQLGQVQGASTVRGLLAKNNVATPATQFDIAADSVTVCNPATGSCVLVSAPGSITVNAATAGPAANGRDQAAAFSTNTWLYLYYIWNGALLRTIISTVPPPVGPTMPAGYTHWAYVGAIFWSTSLASIRIRGSWANYVVSPSIVTGGTSTTVAAVSLTSVVPPNAMEFKLYVPNLGISSNGSGAYGVTCAIQVEAGATPWQCGLQGVAAASQPQFISGGFTTLANVSQGINYQLQITTGAGPTVTIGCQGYSNPNGA